MATNSTTTIQPDITVRQLLDRWPHLTQVFLDRQMACVGCPISRFETIEEVARVYCENPHDFVALLRQAAEHHHKPS